MTESFPVAKIVTNANTQCRVAMDKETVKRYAELLGEVDKGEWPFPALKLTYDGETYYLASGFHRLAAAMVHKLPKVPVEIIAGSVAEAFQIGLLDNQGPMSPTPADRRYAAERLLKEDSGRRKAGIAEMCGLSRRTVQRIAAELDGRTGDSVTSTNDQQGEDAEGVNTVEPQDDAGTDSTGMDASPPPDMDVRTGGGGGSSSNQGTKPPKRDPVAIQKTKTVKTAEALCRAFDDLQELQPSSDYETCNVTCVELVSVAKDWRK